MSTIAFQLNKITNKANAVAQIFHIFCILSGTDRMSSVRLRVDQDRSTSPGIDETLSVGPLAVQFIRYKLSPPTNLAERSDQVNNGQTIPLFTPFLVNPSD